jgi:hypothetical protein
MLAHSHQGHGPRADQIGRIFRKPSTISLARAQVVHTSGSQEVTQRGFRCRPSASHAGSTRPKCWGLNVDPLRPASVCATFIDAQDRSLSGSSGSVTIQHRYSKTSQSHSRPIPAHRPNNPIQQCYAPLLHSLGRRNTLMGLNLLDLLNIQKRMVPRKGLEPSRP